MSRDAVAQCPRVDPADAPRDMIVGCPMAQCALRVAEACKLCPHFAGLIVVNPSEQLAWQDRHRVLCTYRRIIPIDRLGAAADAPAATIGDSRIA